MKTAPTTRPPIKPARCSTGAERRDGRSLSWELTSTTALKPNCSVLMTPIPLEFVNSCSKMLAKLLEKSVQSTPSTGMTSTSAKMSAPNSVGSSPTEMVTRIMSEDLPKQELLIKPIKMSPSPNDGEALIAVRKANELLKSAGWDWEKLVNGKIKVIADPFAKVDTPMNRSIHNPPQPPRPAPRPTPPPSPAAPQAPRPTPPPPR